MYSHAAVTTAGRLAFIAGQVAVDLKGALVSPNDFAGQVPAVFANLERVLTGLGAGFCDVVQFTTYIVGAANRDAWQAGRKEVYARIYPSGSYPPNTLLIIDALARPEYRLEIAAIARLPD
jgi:enamine deaminase RidA (YjgF/YER057c/UK114 family)